MVDLAEAEAGLAKAREIYKAKLAELAVITQAIVQLKQLVAEAKAAVSTAKRIEREKARDERLRAMAARAKARSDKAELVRRKGRRAASNMVIDPDDIET
jgi:hypothetical protein